MMLRWWTILGATAAALYGCSVEDSLEGAPCNSVDDCVGDQACVQTLHAIANNLPGVCHSGGGVCEPGQTVGCVAAGDVCDNFLATVAGPNGVSYCCETSDSTIMDADGQSAVCSAPCDQSLCTSGQETCTDGQPRCVVVEGICGCRVPDDQVENSDCVDDDTCGEGFSCVRTLEQATESQEASAATQMQQTGTCRPDSDLQCALGQQDGCQKDPNASCSSGLSSVDNGPLSYCCQSPDGSGFTTKIYQVSADEREVACTWCSVDCAMGTACTELSAPGNCTITSGLCGCTTM